MRAPEEPMTRRLLALAAPLTFAMLTAACKDDGGAPGTKPDGGTGTTSTAGASDASAAAVTDGARPADAAAASDAGRTDGAGRATGSDAAAGGPDGSTASAAGKRGEYLVRTLLGCVGCHTPAGANEAPDMTKLLAGRTCFIDSVPPNDNGMGCLHAPNLTNDVTGLKNRTDVEIKDMITKGKRPDDKFMFSSMPYHTYALLAETDVNAIVAYLRTVPAVNNMLPANEGPQWANRPAAATMLLKENDLPAVAPGSPNAASAGRGKALAGAVCLACHTPSQPAPMFPIKLGQAFEGGREYPNQNVGGMVRSVFSTNLTPHESGIAGWSAADLAKALKEGKDKSGKGICAPMPSGPMGAYKDIDAQDAMDIAHYLTAIPAKMNMIPMACER
jgi:mono/diheme cytochrome c family protein